MLNNNYKSFSSEFSDVESTLNLIDQIRKDDSDDSIKQAFTLARDVISRLTKHPYDRWDDHAFRIMIRYIFSLAGDAFNHQMTNDFITFADTLNNIYYSAPEGIRQDPTSLYYVALTQFDYFRVKLSDVSINDTPNRLLELHDACKRFENLANLLYESKSNIMQIAVNPDFMREDIIKIMNLASVVCLHIYEHESALKFLRYYFDVLLEMPVVYPELYPVLGQHSGLFARDFSFDPEYHSLFSFMWSLFHGEASDNNAKYSDFAAICFTFKNNITPTNAVKLSNLLVILNFIDKLLKLGAFTKNAAGEYLYPFPDGDFREKMSLPGNQKRFQEWREIFTSNRIDLINLNSHPQLVVAQQLEIQHLKGEIAALKKKVANMNSLMPVPAREHNPLSFF